MGAIGRYQIAILVCAAVGTAVGNPCLAQTVDVSRIRPATGFETGVIQEGLCSSATFRSLVDRLQTSDLIVYVAIRRLPDRRLTGSLEFLGATATHRVLRVVTTFPLDRVSRVAVLGHELQHALEVADAAEIRSSKTFDAYFRAHGLPGAIDSGYDTGAARLTEIRIRHELSGRTRACGAESRRN